MTDQQLYRIPSTRHATGDALRTLVLILATVLIGLAVVAIVPDEVWTELGAEQSDALPDWHGNVASARIYD
jgi:hypothetical protein